MAAGTGAAAAGGTVLFNGTSPAGPNDPPGSVTRPGGSTSSAASAAGTVGTATGQRPAAATTDRMLVVLEMPGGNDGLSLAVPHGRGKYYDRRRRTAIAASDVLGIDDEVGLHPNLSQLHQRGISLVEGVGSTTPDGSHFEMQARWWAGTSNAGSTATGWVGRLADLLRDDAIPAAAVSVGSGAHPIVRSATGSTLSMPSADAVWALAGADQDDEFRSAYQRTLRTFAAGDSAHARTLGATIDFAETIVALDDGSEPDELGYEGWGLGSALQFAALVLAGGTGVKVVHVSMSGDFDTHEGHDWRHPELMRELDTNLAAFHGDLDRRGIGDKVLVMTTSEFGRTLAENASGGLDHGTASTMFLSGPNTGAELGWRHGELPSLTDLDDNGDVKATVPLESYLGGVVEGWLGVPATEVFADSAPLPLSFA